MRNIDKIKSMDIDEMAEFLLDRACCDSCKCNLDDNKCMAVGCREGIKQWLESEVRE